MCVRNHLSGARAEARDWGGGEQQYRRGEQWPDSGYLVKVEPKGFSDSLDVGHKRKSRIEMAPRMCLSNWKDRGPLTRQEGDESEVNWGRWEVCDTRYAPEQRCPVIWI